MPNARARILAVDDEAVILDSFRKILVLAGFSVDTVETAARRSRCVRAERLRLRVHRPQDARDGRRRGGEVGEAPAPDLDVAVITGFGTIETAVETMAHGAVDYVQKPFTEEELVAFANRLLIKREARLEAQSRPTVRVVAPALAESRGRGASTACPAARSSRPGHAWAQIEAGRPACAWGSTTSRARR